MIPIKSEKEIAIMKNCGAIAAQVKKELARVACPGTTTIELDKLAEKMIKSAGALPGFKGYQGFPASIVTCINEEVVHGIPGPRQLKKGDLLTIDLGVYCHGFHTDTALSLLVGKPRQQFNNLTIQQSFLSIGKQALENAINQVQHGNHIGDISHAIQQTIEKAGYNVIYTYTGHGVGKKLHEPPLIPCFGEKGEGEEIELGMVFAVEVMYTAGLPELEILDDDWTAVTKDKKLSAMFEESVAVTEQEPIVLTQ